MSARCDGCARWTWLCARSSTWVLNDIHVELGNPVVYHLRVQKSSRNNLTKVITGLLRRDFVLCNINGTRPVFRWSLRLCRLSGWSFFAAAALAALARDDHQ
jgi:hypothetical protein